MDIALALSEFQSGRLKLVDVTDVSKPGIQTIAAKPNAALVEDTPAVPSTTKTELQIIATN